MPSVIPAEPFKLARGLLAITQHDLPIERAFMDHTCATDPTTDGATQLSAFWRRLLHRWLIEYNPLYLLSAALVLTGVTLVSRAFARQGAIYAELGVAAIAEVYSLALIAGAALLTRIGLRRPAAMLGLLTVVYLGDLTLHTETCIYLAGAGRMAAVAWLALFVGKMIALAWALKLRLTRSAICVPVLGAIGLAVIPHFFHQVTPHVRTLIVAAWVFALFTAGLWTSRRVTHRAGLSGDQQAVMNRTLRAAWAIFGVVAMCHVLFWTREYSLEIGVGIPIGLLLVTRWIRREGVLWCGVIVTLLLTALSLPSSFALTACMSAVILVLRAWRHPHAQETKRPPSASPYRESGVDEPVWVPFIEWVYAPAQRPAMTRYLTGAIACVYLSMWTWGWSGEPWPDHIVALDLLLTAVLILWFWKARVRVVMAPLLATYSHWAVQAHVVTAPRTTLQWGVVSLGLGFSLLIGSVGASWFMRRRIRSTDWLAR